QSRSEFRSPRHHISQPAHPRDRNFCQLHGRNSRNSFAVHDHQQSDRWLLKERHHFHHERVHRRRCPQRHYGGEHFRELQFRHRRVGPHELRHCCKLSTSAAFRDLQCARI